MLTKDIFFSNDMPYHNSLNKLLIFFEKQQTKTPIKRKPSLQKTGKAREQITYYN